MNVLVCSSYKDVGVLVTSHAPITANENLANKPYFCLGLLAKHADLQRPVDAIPIILGIFNTFSPSWDSIPLGTFDDCWETGHGGLLLKTTQFL